MSWRELKLEEVRRLIVDRHSRAGLVEDLTGSRRFRAESVGPAMILAQNGGMFVCVYRTAKLTGQAPLRVAPVVVQLSLLTGARPLVRRVLINPYIYHLLALIAGFMPAPGYIAGALQGFMVYFLSVIHGKFDGSDEAPSFAGRVSPAISGTMPKTLEPAIKRCGR